MRTRIRIVAAVMALFALLLSTGLVWLYKPKDQGNISTETSTETAEAKELKEARESGKEFKLQGVAIIVPAAVDAQIEYTVVLQKNGADQKNGAKEVEYLRIDHGKRPVRVWIVNETNEEIQILLLVESTQGNNKPSGTEKVHITTKVHQQIGHGDIAPHSAVGYKLPQSQETVWLERKK